MPSVAKRDLPRCGMTNIQSISCKMVSWMNYKLESRLLVEISTTSDMQIIPLLMGESEEELKSHLMKMKEEREKAGLKLNIQKAKIMASGPITSWQIDGDKMETVTDLIFWGSKISVNSKCTHEIKRCLLLGRKALPSLDSIFKKQRHHFADKGPSSQSYGFSSSHVWMQVLEHKEVWVLKIWCFQIVVFGEESWGLRP